MTRRRAFTMVPWACLMFLAATLAQAAEDVFKLVPESALGFVAVNRPIAAYAKLQRLGREMQLPLPSLPAKLKGEGGIREALDEKGTAALVVLPPEGIVPLPTPILLVPVTDYAKFIGHFKPEDADAAVTKIELWGKPAWVRSIGGYAALTDVSHREALGKFPGPSKEIPAALAPWRALLAESDLAGAILQPGIKLLSAKVQEGIRVMKTTLAKAGEKGEAAAAGFDMYTKLFQAAEKEVSAYAFGLRLDKQGVLHEIERVRLVPGGQLARVFAQVKPAHEDPLAGLPDGPFVVAGGGPIPEALWQAMMTFSIDIMKAMPKLYGLNEEQAKKMIEASLPTVRGIRGMSIVLGVGPSGASLYSNMVTLMRVDDSQAYLAGYEKFLQQYGELVKNLKSPFLQPMEIEKAKIDGADAFQLTIKAPQAPAGMETPQYKRMMESFFGPSGKLVGWLAAADEHTIVMGYVSKEQLQRTIEAIRQGKPGLAGNPDLAKTVALLPRGGPWVGYWSLQGTVELVNRMIPVMAPPEAKIEFRLPEFPKTPPIGFVVTTAPGELRSHTVYPAEVFTAVGQYVAKIKAMRKEAPIKAMRKEKPVRAKAVPEPVVEDSPAPTSEPKAQPKKKAREGKEAEKTCRVRGEVTLDEKLLTGEGEVLFLASEKRATRAFRTKDGKFDCQLEPGQYRVGIRASRVPAKYTSCDTTDLAVEIKPGVNYYVISLRSN